MRRVCAAMLAVVLLVLLTVPCFAATAEDNVIMPRFTYMKVLTAYFDIDENTGISTSRASCYSLSGYTVEVECELQRQRTNGWTTIKTWTSTGMDYAEVNKDWAVMSGYSYRMRATFTVYASNGNVLEMAVKARYYDYT